MSSSSSSIEITGKTVDEAVDQALEDLDEARENVDVEVLEESPQQARVRVTPPLGCRICPTTALDPGPARNATAPAMSSGLARRRTGICEL